VLEFPRKELTPEQKQALEEKAKVDKRIKEADERINKGQSTEEDIDIMLEEFLSVIEAIEEGKLEFLEPPTQVYMCEGQ
jgi:hypothetical protein